MWRCLVLLLGLMLMEIVDHEGMSLLYCSGLLSNRFGCFFCVRWVVVCIFFIFLLLLELLVE